MSQRLAKLSAVKRRLGFTGTGQDDLLIQLLDQATALAEQLAGRPLRREQDRVEYPYDEPYTSKRLRLELAPVQAAEVVQGYTPQTSAEFDAETPLAEITDYTVDEVAGLLHRVWGHWYLGRRFLRVVYTAGYVDPSRIEVALTGATWTAATATLTEAGAFADYTFAPGDVIVITGGTGVTPDAYRIASRASDDAITLAESISDADLAAGDITSGYAGMVLPPADLQAAIEQQVVRSYTTRDTAGVDKVNHGDASMSLAPDTAHPELMRACANLRRLSL